jgi:hypothetical protein
MKKITPAIWRVRQAYDEVDEEEDADAYIGIVQYATRFWLERDNDFDRQGKKRKDTEGKNKYLIRPNAGMGRQRRGCCLRSHFPFSLAAGAVYHWFHLKRKIA